MGGAPAPSSAHHNANVRARRNAPRVLEHFVNAHSLTGKLFRIEQTDDESGVGADLELLTREQAIDEATNCWPGIGVAPAGYIPVAWCSTGSGDYYYINLNDGPGGPLYRIYHDAVSERGYKPDEAIALVLKNYESLVQHVEP